MRITEIDLSKNGDEYLDNYGGRWVVEGFDMIKKGSRGNATISDYYTLRQILTADYTLVVDWSTVAVDTPIWLDYENGWEPMHFASYTKGEHVIRYYPCGYTSHTYKGNISTCDFKYASLTKPK